MGSGMTTTQTDLASYRDEMLAVAQAAEARGEKEWAAELRAKAEQVTRHIERAARRRAGRR